MDNNIFEQQELLAGKLPSAIGWLYTLLILMIAFMLVISNFIYLDVVVNAVGQTRPAAERTEVRAVSSGIIDSVMVSEGQLVHQGDLLAILKDDITSAKSMLLDHEKSGKKSLLEDLEKLTSLHNPDKNLIPKLNTELCRQEYKSFLHGYNEELAEFEFASKDHQIASLLVKEKVIAPIEFNVKEAKLKEQDAVLKNYWFKQQSLWTSERLKLEAELGQIEETEMQVRSSKKLLELRSPVTGIVQSIQGKYSKGTIQAGEMLCLVSPEDTLVAECYVDPSDIGFLFCGQPVIFRIDAFDHLVFGTVGGTVLSIDKDFIVLNDRPVFKTRCTIVQSPLKLKTGYQARLMKGLSLKARFVIAHRTIWELLFDKLDDWLHPVATI